VIPQSQIDNNFRHHPPTHEQTVKYNILREMAKRFANEINCHCPDSREKSLAMTNLETALFWSNASVARNNTD